MHMYARAVRSERRCHLLQCVAGCSRVLQCVAVCCSVLQCIAFGPPPLPHPLVCTASHCFISGFVPIIIWLAQIVYGGDLSWKRRNHLCCTQKGAWQRPYPSHNAQVSSHWSWRVAARVVNSWNWSNHWAWCTYCKHLEASLCLHILYKSV